LTPLVIIAIIRVISEADVLHCSNLLACFCSSGASASNGMRHQAHGLVPSSIFHSIDKMQADALPSTVVVFLATSQLRHYRPPFHCTGIPSSFSSQSFYSGLIRILMEDTFPTDLMKKWGYLSSLSILFHCAFVHLRHQAEYFVHFILKVILSLVT